MTERPKSIGDYEKRFNPIQDEADMYEVMGGNPLTMEQFDEQFYGDPYREVMLGEVKKPEET